MIDRALLLIVIACLVGAAVLTLHALDHDVSSVSVVGELTPAERERIETLLRAAAVDGILSTDLERLLGTLESLEWLRRATARRDWPDRIEIAVEKVEPIARWTRGGWISSDGEPLELPDVRSGLPEFDIAVGSHRQAMEAFRLIDQIASRESLVIERLTQDALGEWRVEFTNGLAVVLGAEALNERMHRALHAYRHVLVADSRQVDYVDARYLSGVAVRFAGTTPALAASASHPFTPEGR